MDYTKFIFPSQKKKPEEERIVESVQYGTMEGDYNVKFLNVPHFVDSETGKLYIPQPVRNKMKTLFRQDPHVEEIELPSIEVIMEESYGNTK